MAGGRGPSDTQVHREREQAQVTLGTADHDTRACRPGANRVRMPVRAPCRPCRPGEPRGGAGHS
nr:hypothetical protein asmbl_4 [uncultured bacterium]